MEIIRSIVEMRARARRWRRGPGAVVGLVPTMGALHAGHVSLLRAARAECDLVVASLFVNPLQFAANEDFGRYPRTFDADCEIFERESVDVVFAPSAEAMYPRGVETLVDVPEIGGRLDGITRPGHFRGVATVVTKLFHIVLPDRAYFGQKDAAQVAVLNAMVRDLNFDVELVVCPTVRDGDGVALSSRNVYLSPPYRVQARVLSRALQAVEQMVEQGERDSAKLLTRLNGVLRQAPTVQVEYAAIVDPWTLLPVEDVRGGALVAVAATVEGTRLIDNVLIEPERT